MNAIAKFIAKLAVSGLLIWVLLRGLDRDALLAHISGVAPASLLAGWAILMVLTLIQAWRWQRVIRALGRDIAWRESWITVMIGQFFNQSLPSSIGGDAVRIWRAAKIIGPGRAASSVVLDRLTALVAVLALALLAQPALFPLLPEGIARWGMPGAIAMGFVGFAFLMVLDRTPEALLRWRPMRWAAQFSSDARRVFLAPRAALAVVGASFVIHVSVALVVMLVARGLGLPIDILDCLMLVPPIILLTTIPISIAGWGVREGAMVAAFGLIGVDPAQALALSVLFGLLVVAAGLPGGAVWLLARGRHQMAADAPAGE